MQPLKPDGIVAAVRLLLDKQHLPEPSPTKLIIEQVDLRPVRDVSDRHFQPVIFERCRYTTALKAV